MPSIGKSVEGRDMPAVHITAATAANHPKIYFQCQIHARKLLNYGIDITKIEKKKKKILYNVIV